MSNLIKSQQQLETQDLTHSVTEYIALAIERTNTEPFNVDKMVCDIIQEFKSLKDIDFMRAIRSGSLGKYGRTYKLSTQEVCIWIREYLKENNSKLGI